MAADVELYGVLAEFADADSLLTAAQAAHEAGYQRVDAYSPFPVEGLAERLGMHSTQLPLISLIGGITGCAGGFGLAYYCAAVAYPLNIGGRPLNSWPAFIPVTFEVTILLASLATVFGMLGLNGLPRPHHPLFAIERFAHASRDAFFLCIERRDPLFDLQKVRQFLQELQPMEVTDVPQ